MSRISTVLIAALVAAAPAGARAESLLTVPVSSDHAVPVADGEFDWNGFYAGVYGVGQSSPADGAQFGLGVDIGASARFEMVLVGGEVSYQGVIGGTGDSSSLQGVGKLGLALRTTPCCTRRPASAWTSARPAARMLCSAAVLNLRSPTMCRWTRAICMGSRFQGATRRIR